MFRLFAEIALLRWRPWSLLGRDILRRFCSILYSFRVVVLHKVPIILYHVLTIQCPLLLIPLWD